jgi:hypothetical protein
MTDWISPVGEHNALALRAQHGDAFTAIAEADRLGHLLLKRASDSVPMDPNEPEEWLTGIALLRRAVSTFSGTRALLLAAAVDPAKALARAHFETWLHFRVLVHGPARDVSFDTPLDDSSRPRRGRQYHVASVRRGLRARALLLASDSPFRNDDPVKRDQLHQELVTELSRVRRDYPDEWKLFGDLTEGALLEKTSINREREWYSLCFAPQKVGTVRQLAYAFGYHWEYDIIYDSLSSRLHPRGWSHDLTIEDDGVAVHHPHNPESFGLVSFLSTTWHAQLMMAAARAYAPAMIESLQAFHVRNAPALRALNLEAGLLRLA